MDPRFPRYPVSYTDQIQIWHGTPSNPYPMNFVQAPSYSNQKLVNYQGQTYLQGLSTIKGPIMYPINGLRGFPTRDKISTYYPLDPFNTSYLR